MSFTSIALVEADATAHAFKSYVCVFAGSVNEPVFNSIFAFVSDSADTGCNNLFI